MFKCSNCKTSFKNYISRQNVYGCSNVHLLCQNCSVIVQKCPICSEKDCRKIAIGFTRNHVFLSTKNFNNTCKYDYCKVEVKNPDDLTVHEKFCIHREVPCPSVHRGACNWNGPLSKLLEHFKKYKCVEVVFEEPGNAIYNSFGCLNFPFS